MSLVRVAEVASFDLENPQYALVAGVDLVLLRDAGVIRAFHGRCQHRGALLADGTVEGGVLTCGLHGSTYRADTGTNVRHKGHDIEQFGVVIEDDIVLVDEDEVAEWEARHPQRYRRDAYLGLYADHKGADEEPHNGFIHELARHGLEKVGHHGPMASMGVSRERLPTWDDIQLVTAQLARHPLDDGAPVETSVVIGPNAARPLRLEIPLFVSDMSFGALSEEAKTALSMGADAAGTGICSGEGGMLPEEQESNGRYFYELASGWFGYSLDKVQRCQAFHFKLGQAAKTGTGGHLPGKKVKGRIAEVRGLPEGADAISPAAFREFRTPSDFREFAATVREATGGIPIGVKLSAQQIEEDLDAALEIGVDYVILDGRGGGTGAAPRIFRDNISVPTIPALARARHHLDSSDAAGVTLVITGGLRTPADFVKALALGADAVAISNAAMQAIGCLGMRACQTNNCPVGVATQNPKLRARQDVQKSAAQLTRFLTASVELMQLLARACGHESLAGFSRADLTTFSREMADLSGVRFGGVAGR